MAPLTSVARKSMRSVVTAWAYPVTEPTAWMWVMLNEPCWDVLVDTGRAPPSGTAPPLTTTVRVLKKYWVLLTFLVGIDLHQGANRRWYSTRVGSMSLGTNGDAPAAVSASRISDMRSPRNAKGPRRDGDLQLVFREAVSAR